MSTVPTTRLGKAALLSVAALALLVGAGAPVTAAPAPVSGSRSPRADESRFLEADELPRTTGEWTAGEVVEGLPEHVVCVGEALPEEGAFHRSYHTDLEAEAVQVVLTTPDGETAEDLADRVRQEVRECPPTLVEGNPGASAHQVDHASRNVRDGVTVQGVYAWYPESEPSQMLFAVGRSGSQVTVVVHGRMGTEADAPVGEFTRTATTAVRKLPR